MVTAEPGAEPFVEKSLRKKIPFAHCAHDKFSSSFLRKKRRSKNVGLWRQKVLCMCDFPSLNNAFSRIHMSVAFAFFFSMTKKQ
jgi:hypothetical protein